VWIAVLQALLCAGASTSRAQNIEPGGTLSGFSTFVGVIPQGIDNAIAIGVREFGGAVILADGSMLVFDLGIVPAGNPQPVVNVWTSHFHSMALQVDGTLFFPEPGVFPAGLPNQPPPEAVDLVDAAIHFESVLGLRSDGTVVGWGNPDGPGQSIDVPAGLDQVVRVACNQQVGVAVKADGTVVQWGADGFEAPPENLGDVVSVVATDSWVLALRSDGSAVSWGNGSDIQMGPMVEIRAGLSDTVGGITADGSVAFWPPAPHHPLAFISDLAISHSNEDFAFIQKNGMLPFGSIMPKSAKKIEGTDIVLRAHAIGANSYQWKRDGVAIPNATQPWFFIDSLDATEVGDYTVEMMNLAGGFETEATKIELDLIDQSIEVEPVDPRLFGDPPFGIVASASSGLPVQITVEYGPATLDGNTVTITGNGTVRIVITQPGNADYEPAEPIIIEFDTGTVPGPLTVESFSDSRLDLGLPWFSSHPIGVEFSPDLTQGSWIELGNFSLIDGAGLFVDTDSARVGGGRGYYRAFLRP